MHLSSAYLLVSHGSRDSRPQVALNDLADGLTQKLSESAASPHPLPCLGTACLELSPTPLHEQICEFGWQASAKGYQRLQILPLFLLPGVHVREDIPAEVAIAASQLPQLILELRPYLGQDSRLRSLLMAQMQQFPAHHWILLAHGSRRLEAVETVQSLAAQLGAVPAYWYEPDSLRMQVEQLMARGCEQIGILPYFLFPGGITDALVQQVADLQQQFSHLKLHLAQPLSNNSQFANLLFDYLVRPELAKAIAP